MSTSEKSGTGRRWLLLGPLLVGAAWLAYFGDKLPTNDAVSLPVLRAAPAATEAAPVTGSVRTPTATPHREALASLLPRSQLIPDHQTTVGGHSARSARDPFSARDWNPLPPPQPATASAAVPVAPPLPYAFVGKKQEGGTWEVYLTVGEQTFVAREGEVLDNNYRVDKISPPTLTLIYLPLGEVQSLSIGDAR